jgi:hypothetical protein
MQRPDWLVGPHLMRRDGAPSSNVIRSTPRSGAVHRRRHPVVVEPHGERVLTELRAGEPLHAVQPFRDDLVELFDGDRDACNRTGRGRQDDIPARRRVRRRRGQCRGSGGRDGRRVGRGSRSRGSRVALIVGATLRRDHSHQHRLTARDALGASVPGPVVAVCAAGSAVRRRLDAVRVQAQMAAAGVQELASEQDATIRAD